MNNSDSLLYCYVTDTLTHSIKIIVVLSNIICRSSVLPNFGETFEEVMVQDIANFQQQIGIDIGTVEKVVGILPRTMQLSGKPRHGSLLPSEFLLNKVADMWFAYGHYHCFLASKCFNSCYFQN